MGEPQKEPAATANTKNRSSLQDEDIGKDFFSSWKSMSVAEDDAMDFNYEPLPKGKKNSFSFDQLDMDFGLGGDFDKISSSFKVSMPDLDFSSPPKRLGKQNEKTGKENSSGKSEDKQDRSSFNFDFNVFDSFDLDSSLLKEEKKSEKGSEHAHANRSDSSPKHDKNQSVINNLVTGIDALEGSHDSVADGNPPASAKIGNLNALDNCDLDSSWPKGGKKFDKAPGSAHEKMLDSQCEHESSQSSRSNLAVRADSFDDSRSEKFPKLKSATTSKIEHLIGGPTSHVSKIDSSPSTSANCENLNVSYVATSPEKEITSRTKVSDHFNRQSRMTDTTKPLSNHTTQDLFISSVHGNNVFQEAVPELQEEFSFVPEVNTTKDGEQDGAAKPATAFESRVSSSLTNIRGLQSTNNEIGRKLENKNVVPVEYTSCGASIEGHTDDKDASVSSAAENTVCSKKLTIETTNSISKLQVAPTNSDPRISKHLQVRGKGMGHVSLKPLPRSDAAGAQVNTAPAQSKSCSLNDKRTECKSLSSVHERRLECGPGDAQAGDRRVSALKLPDSAGRKGVTITEECVKNNAGQTTSSGHVRPASLLELTTKSSDLRCTNPKLPALSIASTNKVVSSSEVLNKTLDTSLKVSRPMIAKNDLQHSSLHRQIRSLKPTEVNKELHVREPNTASTVAAEKRGLLSPSLKRKTFEASSDAAPDTLYPSRSINESPSQNRKALKTSETHDKKLAPNLGSPLSGYRTSRFEPDTSMAEFEVPLTMENDGIVEKAEACAKELEDICNMLKKKHEEAKELLVCAIVNNNNLLMLNHPIYEEKIRSAQNFANRVMEKELETC